MNGLPPMLIVHIGAAAIGLISGFLSMLLRKGSGLHRAAGNVFFVSMITMTLSAVYVAVLLRPNMLNVVVALLTFYLVTTSWRAARHRDGGTSLFDVGALLFVAGVAAAGFTFGVQAVANGGTKNSMPAPIYFFFASMAVLAIVSDVRMLRRGGVTGPARIARHLYRMCFALLIATFSFFPGQAKLFSPEVRRTGLLFAPHLFLIGSLIYWRFRVMRKRVTRADDRPEAVLPAAAPLPSHLPPARSF